ncbi:MAG: radical SAM protein [Desulfobacteraceae bacterium]|jgi:biotin synthase-like enzyme
MTGSTIERYAFETGVYRPPSEGGNSSLLVRFTRNCPWNRCGFCAMYKTEKFELRPLQEIKQDIDAMAAVCSDLRRESKRLGYGGEIVQAAAIELIGRVPELNQHQGFVMVYNWLLSGAKTAFLQDANSLIMKTDVLVEALTHLRQTFPSLARVTTYARAKTVAQKSARELSDIRLAGLDRLHLGLESGDDALLKMIKKGVTAEGHIKAGRKAMAAGFQVSEYWMPGLGGKADWQNHAKHTARVLNEINPHYIRSRPFFPMPGTPLYDDLQHQAFEMLSAQEQLLELKHVMAALDVTSKVCFDHAGNYWKDRNGNYLFTHSYEGYQFPNQKQEVLDLIEEGLKAGNQRPNLLRL